MAMTVVKERVLAKKKDDVFGIIAHWLRRPNGIFISNT
jgi:hypothetical protein